ncbi:formylglycine-generating enzyme family protein [Fimbriiglobus ruber]|uniref:Sulfatase-modifying factor enzyme-like domain-containing protein n=1 Tax=Fimbriiglobus ruber TaxID=1908690 RepID=A0A225D3L7_9BACT|nr:SUMF1/EgtB/PvdO family nonheme iron enzyme [Fimbriiglobus ruber]OWK36102.1 protein of unknown function DUF323 [Fimbriiglobus ruber]
MKVRYTVPSLVLAAASVGVVFATSRADDAAKQLVPPAPVVPVKLDLPAKNFTETLPGTEVKFEMVYVPTGEYTMGSPDDEPGRDANEGPRRKVKVKAFWLGKCEVTWDEYYKFWNDEKLFMAGEVPEDLKKVLGPDAITKPTNTFVDELYDHGRDGHPAVCMSHHAAMMYCHWLRWKTKKGYRLPTEAEWEFACRAGHDGPYGFDKAEKLGDYAWYKENSATKDSTDPNSRRADDGEPTTHKVGTKKANKLGLHDMHGNVSEWCLDQYDPKFRESLPADKVILGAFNKPTDKKWSHVVRGGSWADLPTDPVNRLRSASRRVSDRTWMKNDPQVPRSIWWLTKLDVVGFRVCVPVEEYPELVGLKPMVEKKPD